MEGPGRGWRREGGWEAFTPATGIWLCVGLYPTTPQKEAGRMMDPPVCAPRARGTISSATAA